jgi:hypothetical protein
MKLKPSTKINSVLFYKKDTNEVIGSSDLNMTFGEYNQRSLGKTESMLGLDYKLEKTVRSQGYTFKLYVCENENLITQFIELTR